LITFALIAGLARPATAQDDALHRKILGELQRFVSWLDANGARGFVGEIGWPDEEHGGESDRWNALADAWYDDADAAGLWAGVWATGEWWGKTYKLAAYEDRSEPPGVDTPNTQAPVIEAHLSTDAYERAITVAGGEFAGPEIVPTSTYSNHDPGKYNRDYHFDAPRTFEFLAGRGIGTIRIEFRWETIQRKLGGALHSRSMDLMDSVVLAARQAGLNVVLDMHNFGAYYLWNGKHGVRRAIGSPKLPIRFFADVWTRLSAHYRVDPGIYYGLMNEPVGLSERGDLSAAQVWERASQEALDAVRANGDDNTVMVSGYAYSPVRSWADIHPDGWIEDPAGNFLYEGHHYWDRDASGGYERSYAREVAYAERHGY
jgi:aryl-phospho-beta-D-glucosidase BglC (GH1 family)